MLIKVDREISMFWGAANTHTYQFLQNGRHVHRTYDYVQRLTKTKHCQSDADRSMHISLLLVLPYHVWLVSNISIALHLSYQRI
jgi:hypothetical protein